MSQFVTQSIFGAPPRHRAKTFQAAKLAMRRWIERVLAAAGVEPEDRFLVVRCLPLVMAESSCRRDGSAVWSFGPVRNWHGATGALGVVTDLDGEYRAVRLFRLDPRDLELYGLDLAEGDRLTDRLEMTSLEAVAYVLTQAASIMRTYHALSRAIPPAR